MSNVGKSIARAVTAAGTLGLSEATGVGSMISGQPKGASSPDVKIEPVTPEQKAELDKQDQDQKRKAQRFTTLLTSRASRESPFSKLENSLGSGFSSLKKTLG